MDTRRQQHWGAIVHGIANVALLDYHNRAIPVLDVRRQAA